jgi:hypothetical protein
LAELTVPVASNFQSATPAEAAIAAASGATQELEAAVLRLEQQLSALVAAMCRQDALAIELAAGALHKALAQAVEQCSYSKRLGYTVGAPLRQRLVAASGQVAALREALARATASLDRAIDVLLPSHASQGVYDAHGANVRGSYGAMQA